MRKPIDPVVTQGFILGRCPKCRGEYSGNFFPHIKKVKLSCFSCGHEGRYFINPDERPKATLRHENNRQIVSTGAKRRRRKKPKSNPDGVIKGQLAFEMPDARFLSAGIIP